MSSGCGSTSEAVIGSVPVSTPFIVLTAVLGLGAFAPPLRSWKLRHATFGALVLVSTAVFYLLLVESFDFVAKAEPRLERLEQRAPP
jgi:hypothetical protein